MAFRSGTQVLRNASGKTESVLRGEGGLRGLIHRLKERLSSGKILRPDVEEDVLRLPVEKSHFRYPSPGEQEQPVIPQGPYKNVFDITYHARDSRRKNLKEELESGSVVKQGLPPTPGTPPGSVFLGMAGDFDKRN